jgi:hypothetical protein
MAALDLPSAARGALDEASVSVADRLVFIDTLKSFLTSDSTDLDLGAEHPLAVWGESLSHIVSYLFARARVPSPKMSAIAEEEEEDVPDEPDEQNKTGSNLKEYQLTPDEFQLWREIQKERTQSQIKEVPDMPSSEVFVVDSVEDVK